MARRFDGGSATDKIATVSGSTVPPFSIGCWIKMIAYATGRIIAGAGTTNSSHSGLQTGASTAQRFGLRCLNATTHMVCEVTAPATGAWICVVGVCTDNLTAANNKIYTGSQSSAMAAQTHQSDTNGVGAATTNSSGQIGKSGTATSAVNGDIAQAFSVPFAMTADEVERFRQGDWSVLWRGGIPNFFVPMEAGGAGLRDLGLAVNWVITGTPDLVEDPPIASGLRAVQAVVATRKASTLNLATPSGALTPAGVEAEQTNKTPAGAMTPSGTLSKPALKAITAAMTPGGTLVKQRTAPKGGGSTPTGAETRVIGKTVTGVFT